MFLFCICFFFFKAFNVISLPSPSGVNGCATVHGLSFNLSAQALWQDVCPVLTLQFWPSVLYGVAKELVLLSHQLLTDYTQRSVSSTVLVRNSIAQTAVCEIYSSLLQPASQFFSVIHKSIEIPLLSRRGTGGPPFISKLQWRNQKENKLCL